MFPDSWDQIESRWYEGGLLWVGVSLKASVTFVDLFVKLLWSAGVIYQ